MSEHGFYTGKELLALPPNMSKPLITEIINERDVVILVGKEKSGKSVFAQQASFALSCGEPLLSQFTTQKCCIIYVQVEGKLGETQDRIYKMRKGVSWDPENFNLIFYPGLALNIKSEVQKLVEMIDERLRGGVPIPKLIILDPLYMCVQGNISEQVVASDTCKAFRLIADRYNCALLIVHHEHRPKMDKGKKVYEGDDSIFGSFVWKAFPDHVLCFRKSGKGTNELTCSTQRSQDIIERVELTYAGPEPMMFEIKADVAPYVQLIKINLSKTDFMSAKEIAQKSSLGYSTVMGALRNMRKSNLIERVGDGYPVKWRLK